MNGSILDTLDKKVLQQLLIQSVGFEEVPTDMHTFLYDDYYLGRECGLDDLTGLPKTYKIWENALEELFPDPISSNTFVALTGAIGTGKSRTAKIIMAKQLEKILKTIDFYSYNGLNEYNKPHVFFFGHTDKYKAEANMNEFLDMLHNSPYFEEQFNDPDSALNKHILFVSGREPGDFIGRNLVCAWITEINFFKRQEQATQLIDSTISRWNSRYRKSWNTFSSIILDSSDTFIDSALPNFLKHSPWGRETKVYRYSIWDAKPDQYFNKPDKTRIDLNEYLIDSNGKKYKNENYGKPALTFRVYSGDPDIFPCIIDDNTPKDILAKLDPDRLMDVPNELRNQFEGNIELALQETCGRAVETAGRYYNTELVLKSFTIPSKIHRKDSDMTEDIICCSFFDENDKYIDYVRDAIDLIPKNRSAFVGIDMGLNKDRAGFCVGYLKDVGERIDDGIKSYDPIYSIPIAFAISRLVGEETSFRKIVELIQWIHTKRPIYRVTTDTFQSYIIEQACTTMNIKHKFISVDKSIQPWKVLKDAFYRSKIELIKNDVLKYELINLYYDQDKQKVEHHEELDSEGHIGSNSKDISDAIAKCVYDMYGSLTEDAESVINPDIVSNSAWAEKTNEYIAALRSNHIKQQFRQSMRNLGYR